MIEGDDLTGDDRRMIRPDTCRAARALKNIHQLELAEAAHVSISTIRDFEADKRIPRTNTLQDIQRALEAAGVEFIPGGVRLKDSP